MTGLTWLLIAGVALLLVYEVLSAVRNTPGSDPLTISQIIWRASTRSPFVPFAFGVLAGHLFA